MNKFLHSKQQFPFFKDVSKIAQNKLKPRHDGTENKSSFKKKALTTLAVTQKTFTVYQILLQANSIVVKPAR